MELKTKFELYSTFFMGSNIQATKKEVMPTELTEITFPLLSD